jgi:hypothetical protein
LRIRRALLKENSSRVTTVSLTPPKFSLAIVNTLLMYNSQKPATGRIVPARDEVFNRPAAASA